MSDARVPAETEQKPKRLVESVGERYGVEPGKLLATLRATAFKQTGRDAAPVSNEQMMALLVVADQYGLNPFTREIYAFPDKQNGIVPVVGIDGWIRIANQHKQYDGFQLETAEKWVELDHARPCPESMTVAIFRKDQSQPTLVTEYLDEVYREPFVRRDGSVSIGPWQQFTKRMLRHKTLMQGFRVAFGFAGVYDEDEASRIIEGEVVQQRQAEGPSLADRLAAAASSRPNPPDAIVDEMNADSELLPIDTTGVQGRETAPAAIDGEVVPQSPEGGVPTEKEPLPDRPPITADDIGQMIADAKSLDELPEIRDLMREFPRSMRMEMDDRLDRKERQIKAAAGEEEASPPAEEE